MLCFEFLEFFIDGLGSLHVGSCDDVIVNHATKIKLPWGQSESDKTYAKFRYPPASSDATHTKNGLLYFKNRFQCLTHNWTHLDSTPFLFLSFSSNFLWVAKGAGEDTQSFGPMYCMCGRVQNDLFFWKGSSCDLYWLDDLRSDWLIFFDNWGSDVIFLSSFFSFIFVRKNL